MGRTELRKGQMRAAGAQGWLRVQASLYRARWTPHRQLNDSSRIEVGIILAHSSSEDQEEQATRGKRLLTPVAGLLAIVALIMTAPTARALPIEFTATFTGPGESPPNASPGTGFADVFYDIRAVDAPRRKRDPSLPQALARPAEAGPHQVIGDIVALFRQVQKQSP